MSDTESNEKLSSLLVSVKISVVYRIVIEEMQIL